jgi:signal transduction histidine kinase
LRIEKFDLRDLMSQIIDSLKVQLGKDSKLQLASVGEDFNIEGDKLHLTGMIHNLVDNAIKYGGNEPQVDIDLSQRNGALILKVTDHGVGIPKEYRDKIFEKFFRVPSGDIHNIKGYGLGLSYVAEVAREHHGKIDVQSEPGKGSTFTVTLPRTYAN